MGWWLSDRYGRPENRQLSSLFPDCTPVVSPLTASACRLMGQRSFSSLVELDRSRPLGPALARSSPDNDWHYLLVDTKFTTLHLNASGTELSNEGSASAYKAQVYIYNRMLGRLQDFEPPNSYLLGRGWQRKQKGDTYRGTNALGRLGPVPQNGTVLNGVLIANAVEDALGWIRKVRTEGKDWQLLPKPSVPELYPNMSNTDDANMMLETGPAELESGFGEEEPAGRWIGAKKWLGW